MTSRFSNLREQFYQSLYDRIAPAETGLRILGAIEDGSLRMDRPFTLHDVHRALDMPRLADDLAPIADPLGAVVNDARERADLYIRLALHTMMTSTDAILDAACVFEDVQGVRFRLTRGDLSAIQKRAVFLHPVQGYEVPDPQARTFLEFSMKTPA